METIDQVATRVVDILCPHKAGMDRINAINGVAYNFKTLLDDTLLLYKNIQETSLPGKDKEQRLLDLEKRLGVQLRFTR